MSSVLVHGSGQGQSGGDKAMRCLCVLRREQHGTVHELPATQTHTGHMAWAKNNGTPASCKSLYGKCLLVFLRKCTKLLL